MEPLAEAERLLNASGDYKSLFRAQMHNVAAACLISISVADARRPRRRAFRSIAVITQIRCHFPMRSRRWRGSCCAKTSGMLQRNASTKVWMSLANSAFLTPG